MRYTCHVNISIFIHSYTDITFIMKYYSAIKKNEILIRAATCMDLENVKSDKDKHYMISLTRGI